LFAEKIELHGMWALWVWARSRPLILGLSLSLVGLALSSRALSSPVGRVPQGGK